MEGLQEKRQNSIHQRRQVKKSRKFDHYWDAFPTLRVDHGEDLDFEELVQLAILQYCSHTVKPQWPGASTHIASRMKLTEQLPIYVAEREMSQLELEAVAWMWLLTMYAWQMPGEELQDGEVGLLARLPSTLRAMETGTGLQEVLKKYLWTDDFLVFGKRCWEHTFGSREVKPVPSSGCSCSCLSVERNE